MYFDGAINYFRLRVFSLVACVRQIYHNISCHWFKVFDSPNIINFVGDVVIRWNFFFVCVMIMIIALTD